MACLRALPAVVVTLATAPLAQAGVCPPAVALTGDAAVVRAVRDELDARGIAGETASCPVVRAHVERRGDLLVVGIERRDAAAPGAAAPGAAAPGAAMPGAIPGTMPGTMPGAMIERVVTEPATAATVIESWTRSDVAAPLLAARAVPAGAEPAVVAAAPPAAHGIQLFAAEETSVASDRTVWAGMQLGACVMLGPICAAARLHGGKVIARPASWDRFVRKAAELYVGIDVPIAIGGARLTPGFAAGYGTMLTHHEGDGEHTGVEISGPRAEVHAALSLPLTAHIAIDVVTTAALTQATGMETHGVDAPDPATLFPDEPRALFRIAVGVRYGAL